MRPASWNFSSESVLRPTQPRAPTAQAALPPGPPGLRPELTSPGRRGARFPC